MYEKPDEHQSNNFLWSMEGHVQKQDGLVAACYMVEEKPDLDRHTLDERTLANINIGPYRDVLRSWCAPQAIMELPWSYAQDEARNHDQSSRCPRALLLMQLWLQAHGIAGSGCFSSVVARTDSHDRQPRQIFTCTTEEPSLGNSLTCQGVTFKLGDRRWLEPLSSEDITDTENKDRSISIKSLIPSCCKAGSYA